jgi:hypothetical protein
MHVLHICEKTACWSIVVQIHVSQIEMSAYFCEKETYSQGRRKQREVASAAI